MAAPTSPIRLASIAAGALFVLIGTAVLWAYISDNDQQFKDDSAAAANYSVFCIWFLVAACGLSINTNNPRMKELMILVSLIIMYVTFVGLGAGGDVASFHSMTVYRKQLAIDGISDDLKSRLQKGLAGSVMAHIGMILAIGGAVAGPMAPVGTSPKELSMYGAMVATFIGSIILWATSDIADPTANNGNDLSGGTYAYTGALLLLVSYLAIGLFLRNRAAIIFTFVIGTIYAVYGLAFASDISALTTKDEVKASARAGGVMLWFSAIAVVYSAMSAFSEDGGADGVEDEGDYAPFTEDAGAVHDGYLPPQ